MAHLDVKSVAGVLDMFYKETASEGASNTVHWPKANVPYKEVTAMLFEPNISACGDSASKEPKPTWKSIGDLAAALAKKAGAK